MTMLGLCREIVPVLAVFICVTFAAPGAAPKVKHTYKIEIEQNSGQETLPTWTIDGNDPTLQDLINKINTAGGHGMDTPGAHGGHGTHATTPQVTAKPVPFPNKNGYRGMYITHLVNGKPLHKTALPLCKLPRLHWAIVYRTAHKNLSDERKKNMYDSLSDCVREQWQKSFKQQKAKQAAGTQG